ncbi:MAG: hypothetical protein K0U61_01585 [Alphaproteobacteria bacterium]|nr:hypothetical protein [Alphaproteobacteria bacterium]
MKNSRTIGDFQPDDWRVCSDDLKTHATRLFEAAQDLCDAIEGRDGSDMDQQTEDEAEHLAIQCWSMSETIKQFLERTDPDRDYSYDEPGGRDCDEHRLTARDYGLQRVAL